MVVGCLKFHFHCANHLRDLLTVRTSCSHILLKGAKMLELKCRHGMLEGRIFPSLCSKDELEDNLGALSK